MRAGPLLAAPIGANPLREIRDSQTTSGFALFPRKPFECPIAAVRPSRHRSRALLIQVVGALPIGCEGDASPIRTTLRLLAKQRRRPHWRTAESQAIPSTDSDLAT